MKKVNQIPTPHKKKDDDKYRVFFKSGNSTMLLCEGLSYMGTIAFERTINAFLSAHNTKLKGNLFVTR